MKKLGLVLTMLAMAIGAAGCIRSKVVITSVPDGAEVIWRGKPYGATPVEIPINYYWYYDYSLAKPGYKRVDMLEHFRTPPWFLIPTDFLMEIIPIPIKDTRTRNFVLEPLPPKESAAK